MAFRLGAGGSRDPGCLDRAAARRIAERRPGRQRSYGTTLRVYDASIDAWHIQWTDPVTRNFLQMIGRRQGDDIVQLATRPDGHLIRWSFLAITPNSFLWRGEVSADNGATWRINTEFTARRRLT